MLKCAAHVALVLTNDIFENKYNWFIKNISSEIAIENEYHHEFSVVKILSGYLDLVVHGRVTCFMPLCCGEPHEGGAERDRRLGRQGPLFPALRSLSFLTMILCLEKESFF